MSASERCNLGGQSSPAIMDKEDAPAPILRLLLACMI